MRAYFEHVEKIRKVATAFKNAGTDEKAAQMRAVLYVLIDDYARMWPGEETGECSCATEGSEGCRPHVCPNPQCDSILEGADFCSRECSEVWEDDAPQVELNLSEAAERLHKRLKSD